MTALHGIAWPLVYRNRVSLAVILGYFALFAGVLSVARVGDLPAIPLTVGVLLLGACYLTLLGIFIYQDADVASERSAYPAHMFTLPVPTAKLVLLPMVMGTLTMFGSAIVLTAAAIHAGIGISAVLPAAILTAILAFLQAIFWYPIGIPYSKLVLTLLFLPGLLVSLAVANELRISETVVLALLGACVLACYAIAYTGVAKARRGDLRQFERRSPAKAAKQVAAKRPFPSPMLAQQWYEWRLHGRVLPFMSALFVVLLCLPLFWDNTLSPINELPPNAKGLVPSIPTVLKIYYLALLFMIPWAAWVVGCGAKRSDVKRSDRTLHLFYGTRPVSDLRLTAAKLLSAGTSSAVAWLVVLGLTIPLLLLNGRNEYPYNGGYPVDEQMPLFQVLAPFMQGEVLWRVLACLTLLVLFTWRNYAVGFWTELSGNPWLRRGYPLLTCISVLVTIIVVSINPRQPLELTLPKLNVIVWYLVGSKLIFAAVLLALQYRAKALRLPIILQWTGVYAAACAVISWIALFASEGFRRGAVDAEVATPGTMTALVIGLVIFWVPATRLLAAPIALSLNRHRFN